MSFYSIQPAPLTHIGWGSVAKLEGVLNSLTPHKVLIISDPVLVSLNLVGDITGILDGLHIDYTIYSDLIPEPTIETGQKLVDFVRKEDFSLIIGFGGGSALDMAKLAAVLKENPGDVHEYLNLSGTKKIEKRGIPKILLPTTAGTGAEVTNISVLALEKTKDVVVHDYLIADVSIVDAAFTVSVPPRVTAATGADALTHAIEAFISVNANPYSDGLALQAIKLIGSSLKAAVNDGNNKDARTKMAFGSYIAGLAFFNAGVGAIHALAYPLGGQFHLAHGESNAVLIPYVMNYIKDSCSEKMGLIAEALNENIADVADPANTCIEALTRFVSEIGIPKTLIDFNIPQTALAALVEDGLLQKRLLARCPMRLNEKDIHNIYHSAFTGVPVQP
jgi:alcohol dehydrogenase class IV